jgi:hypothetical protein
MAAGSSGEIEGRAAEVDGMPDRGSQQAIARQCAPLRATFLPGLVQFYRDFAITYVGDGGLASFDAFAIAIV